MPGPYLNQNDARQAAALAALHLAAPLDAAALNGATELPGPPPALQPGAAAAEAAAAQHAAMAVDEAGVVPVFSAAAIALEAAAAAAAGGAAQGGGGWEVEVLHLGPEGGAAPAPGLVAKVRDGVGRGQWAGFLPA
jgi:hypothetical protein